MYPVQPVISYLTTIFTTMMHVHSDATAKQHTGGGGILGVISIYM